jgi:hypothetical protein
MTAPAGISTRASFLCSCSSELWVESRIDQKCFGGLRVLLYDHVRKCPSLKASESR